MSSDNNPTPISKGLEGVVAGDTAVSLVDGKNCQLIYRGYNINELIGQANYEEVSYLLLHGHLPKQSELTPWKAELERYRPLHSDMVAILRTFPSQGEPMALLRTAISLIGARDSKAEDASPQGLLQKAVSIIAKTSTIVATIGRLREGKDYIEPKAGLGHAANFLYCLHGTEPTAEQTQALDAYYVLLAEHGFNASTFTARTVTGTQSDYYSAITGAIGTLKGPLHGAAGRRAMETLIEIGSPDQVNPFVQKVLSDHKRFMGFGHRVYKGEDPRGKHLKRFTQSLSQGAKDSKWFTMAEQLQRAVFEAKSLHINVDFYAAPLLHYLGIPVELFTTLFACSRIAGWSAHVIEQTQDNRLIRPLGHYVGPRDLRVSPIDRR